MSKHRLLLLLGLASLALLLPQFTGRSDGQEALCGGLPVTINWGPGVSATPGDDVILGTEGADHIVALGGDDTVCGLGGDDLIAGQGGTDTLYGGEGADQVFGGVDSDDLWGGAGNDDLRGQGGDDSLMGEGGIDQLYGGSGNDLLETGEGGNFGTTQVARGQGNNDTIRGGPDADDLEGGSGPDELHGGGGDDRLRGGNGFDLLWGDAGADRLEGGSNRDVLRGGPGSDVVLGGLGNDDLYGDDGDDALDGQGGLDLCDGGIGGELLGDSASATCESTLNIPFGEHEPLPILCQGFEPTIFGTDNNDLIEGSAANDVILAGAGNDVINGLGGDDVICGGDGDDIIDGGDGDDILVGDGGTDTLRGGAGHDDLSGRAGDDLLEGAGGTDILKGDSGNDVLNGGDGPDTLAGGPGLDVLNGERGSDTLSGGPSADTLFGGRDDDVLRGDDGADELHGDNGDDLLDGGNQGDELSGGNGSDTLLGGHGPDQLFGGPHDDVLNGGSGPDGLQGNSGDDYLRDGVDCIGGPGTNVIEACTNSAEGSPADAPQIILFAMLDDADYHDFGYNSVDAITPNIDRISAEGASLMSYYAGSGICSPTRLSVMTGENPLASGLTRLWPDIGAVPTTTQLWLGRKGLDASARSLLDLELAGYSSAHFGKWHLGDSWAEHGPGAVGFDTYRTAGVNPVDAAGNVQQVASIPNAQWDAEQLLWPVGSESGDRLIADEWRVDYLADEVIAYLDSLQPGERAFINWWSLVPHTPIRTPPGFDNSETNFDLSTQRGQVLAMMHDWDRSFGRVLDHLDTLGLADDSLVVVTSDNGGLKTALAPDRDVSGAKSSLSEGGIRVPFAARWAGEIPAGLVTQEPATSSDLLETLLGTAGLPQRASYGSDIMPLMMGDTVARPNGMLWQMETNAVAEPGVDRSDQDEWAYRAGCYKVLKQAGETSVRLYNVCDDSKEEIDLSGDLPGLTAQLSADAESQRRDLSRIDVIPSSANEALLIPFDERFNVGDQDFVIEFLVSEDDPSNGPVEIFRSDSIRVYADENAETLRVEVLGVENTSPTITPSLTSRNLVVPFDPDGARVRISVQGFLRDFSSIVVSVDGEDLGTLEGNDSLYALAAGRSPLRIGASGFQLDDIEAHTIVLP